MSSEKQNFQFQQSEKNRRENMNLCITRRRENAPRSNVWLSRGLRAECAQRFRRWLQKTAKFAIKAGHNWVSVLLLSVSLSFFDYKRGNWVYLRRWPVDWLAHNPLIDISVGPQLHLRYNETFFTLSWSRNDCKHQVKGRRRFLFRVTQPVSHQRRCFKTLSFVSLWISNK